MKSLFEEEEKENVLNALKIRLISQFFKFNREQIIKYKDILSFDSFTETNYESGIWDLELIESLGDKFNWNAIYKINTIPFDYNFIIKHESKLNFHSHLLVSRIQWTDFLINEFAHKLNWGSHIIYNKPFASAENLRKYKNIINWTNVSRNLNIEFTEELINEFSDKWDWSKLSENKHLNISIEFIQKYLDKLDFDVLSKNPSAWNLILKYPNSKRWNWENVATNPAVAYNDETFHFIFNRFSEAYCIKKGITFNQSTRALPAFLTIIFRGLYSDTNYFVKDKFIDYMPWAIFSSLCRTKLTFEFIETHKNKIDFTSRSLIKTNKDVISHEFIKNNLELFNPRDNAFYDLPITYELLDLIKDKINWYALSGCVTLDWNWEFIENNFDYLNWYKLSSNKAIYEKLIDSDGTGNNIIEFLDTELVKIAK